MNNEPRILPVIQMQKRRQRKNKTIRLAVVILVGIAMYFLVNQFLTSKTKNSPELVTLLEFIKTNTDLSISEQNHAGNSLQDVVQEALVGTKGTYGIAIKNLKTGESYSVNKGRVFNAGSLYKLWIMAAAFNKIQTGEWREDQVLTEDVAVLNDKFYIDQDLAEQTEGTVTFTVRNALEQMITISHNYAALLLTEKLKLSIVKTFLEGNGFQESTVGTDGSNPTTTPSDIALFFEKLYKGELSNKENTDKMIDLLKKQRSNDKLPKYLPQGVIIAHKTGEIDLFSHDAGIVYSPNGDYIIVVLSESNTPPGAKERISEVSKAVYEYFESKNE